MANHLTRWDPFREAVTLREAMDRLAGTNVSSNNRSIASRRVTASRNGSQRVKWFAMCISSLTSPQP